jgi:hypothetical protein
MQIDRSRFLFLTSAIAAGTGACTPRETIPVTITATPDEPKPDASAPLALTGSVDASSTPVVPVASATTTPTPMTGPSCPDSDNMIGTPGNCGLLKAPGPQCESFADTKEECGHMAKGLKPRVAQRAVDCFLSKSGQKSVCDFELPQACVVQAIAEACIDPAVGAACDSILSNCTPHGRGRHAKIDLTRETCMRALSAVTSRNRGAVMSCVAESCSVSSCFYDLK